MKLSNTIKYKHISNENSEVHEGNLCNSSDISNIGQYIFLIHSLTEHTIKLKTSKQKPSQTQKNRKYGKFRNSKLFVMFKHM